MAIDFPAVNTDPSQPWTNPDTGVTYIYKDGAWRVLSSSDFEDLEDIYVNVSGDNMTGDLTLGTDKITLDATNGNATLAGDVEAGVFFHNQPSGQQLLSAFIAQLDGQDKFRVRADGEITISDANLGNPGSIRFLVEPHGHLALGNDATVNPAIDLKADGTAEFTGVITASAVQNVGGYVGTDPTKNEFSLGPLTTIKSSNGRGANDTAFEVVYGTTSTVNFDCDGSAEFAGAIYSGDWDTSRDDGAGSQVADGVIRVQRPSDRATAFIYEGYLGKNRTYTVSANGSATFAQKVTAKGFVANNFPFDSSITPLYISSDTTAKHPLAQFTSGFGGQGTITAAQIDTDGSAVFQGTVTVNGNRPLILALEPDNEDNFTVTTEDYTETETYTGPLGNTLEREVTKTRDVRTYTGPTLDVKERLQNLIARMDAVEANEVIDDATDNSLLLAVAELTSRLNERDALITTLTTRIEALENA